MELVLGGAVLSLLVQWLKTELKTEGWRTMALLAVIAFVAAALYHLAISVGVWESFVAIFMTANTFYAVILQWFEK